MQSYSTNVNKPFQFRFQRRSWEINWLKGSFVLDDQPQSDLERVPAMGISYYIALDRKVTFNTLVNGRSFAREVDSINRICEELGIPTSYDFLDMSAEAASFGVDPGLPAVQPKWFSCAEGLKWVDSLYAYIDEHPNSLENRAAVLEDLDEFKLVLNNAKRRKVNWHLRIDY